MSDLDYNGLKITITSSASGSGGCPMEALSDRIIESVCARLVRKIECESGEIIEKAITDKVNAVAGGIVEAKITPLIDEVIQLGFPKTNQWGEHAGNNVSITEFLRQQLTHRSNNQSWLNSEIHRALRETIGKQMEGEMKEAQAAFRKAVDERLGSELATAARKAAGIR